MRTTSLVIARVRPERRQAPNVVRFARIGAIEQDADIVLFIYRDSEYNEAAPTDEGDLIIAKHREGGWRMIRFMHNKEMTQFMDAASF